MIPLVGAGRFERPTPCAQGRCATRLRYAPTFCASLILTVYPPTVERRGAPGVELRGIRLGGERTQISDRYFEARGRAAFRQRGQIPVEFRPGAAAERIGDAPRFGAAHVDAEERQQRALYRLAREAAAVLQHERGECQQVTASPWLGARMIEREQRVEAGRAVGVRR